MNLDIVIDTDDDYSVDMKSALNAFQGISDATVFITEAVLDERVPKKITPKQKVRAMLKDSFKGSYGQKFSINIKNTELKTRFDAIGTNVIVELIRYFIYKALYLETLDLSLNAKTALHRLTDIEDELTEQLRKSSLHKAHDIPINIGKSLKIRYRKSSENITEIITLNNETYLNLIPKTDATSINISASITRLNINTGNGRLALEGAKETVSFGFSGKYKEVKKEAKKIFSSNLDDNNGIHSDEWVRLKMSAKPMRLKSGKIIKYIITGLY